MDQVIIDFPTQFGFEPEVINGEKLGSHKHFIIAGMGGSQLASGLLKMYQPGIDIYSHRNYGLPPYSDDFFKDSLLIASSYSGNTGETVSFLEEALAKGYDAAVITTGGKLLELAEKHNLPYIKMLDTGIQPRSALGYSLISMAKMVGQEQCLKEMKDLQETLKPLEIRKNGEELAEVISGKVPIVYSSVANLGVVYNWKIKLNETGKIPAFYNVLPELNHNEMNGMDVLDSTQDISKNFHYIFLKDASDHPKIQKRMDIVQEIYEERGLSVTVLELTGNSLLEKMFNSLLLADWIAYTTAIKNGADPEQVPLIEDFKKKLKASFEEHLNEEIHDEYCHS